MDAIYRKLKNKIYWLVTITFVGFLLISFTGQRRSVRLGQLSLVSDGLQTCFSRINQSFIANLLNQKNGNYLNTQFLNLTEECFSEVVYNSQELLSSAEKNWMSDLNLLANEVNKFHQAVSGKIDNQTVDGQNAQTFKIVSEMYGQIEEQYLNYLNYLDGSKTEIQAASFSSQLLFYTAISILLFFGIMIYINQKKLLQKNNQAEQIADQLLAKEGPLSSATVESIIKKSLDNNELVRCGALFSQYHADLLEGKLNAYMASSNPITSSNEKSSQKLSHTEQLIADFENNPAENQNEQELNSPKTILCTGTSIEKILATTLSRVRPEMNKKGIILETDIDEESLVLVDPEILGQLLFTLVKRAFHQSSHNQLVRRLSIKSKNLGGTVLVEMRDSGNGFESDIVTMPLNVLMQEKKLETDLQICAELVKDINTQMILANYYDRTLDERGGQIQLIFERVETKQTDDQQKKVVKRKGTKKEILRNLR